MIEINLLPWRELEREKNKKEFMLLLLLSLIFSVLMVILVNFYAHRLVDDQASLNKRLEDEILYFDKQT